MLWIIVAGFVAGIIAHMSPPGSNIPDGFILVVNRVVQDPGADKPRL